MSTDDKILEKAEYVLRTDYRRNAILFLNTGFHTPKEVADRLGIETKHASNILAQLRKNGLAYCATPEMRKGRIYILTDDGKEVFKYLQEMNY